jgi:hypothetical protein
MALPTAVKVALALLPRVVRAAMHTTMMRASAKVRASGHEAFEAEADWRERPHDDLVLAVALACWYGERYGHIIPPPVRLEPSQHSMARRLGPFGL